MVKYMSLGTVLIIIILFFLIGLFLSYEKKDISSGYSNSKALGEGFDDQQNISLEHKKLIDSFLSESAIHERSTVNKLLEFYYLSKQGMLTEDQLHLLLASNLKKIIDDDEFEFSKFIKIAKLLNNIHAITDDNYKTVCDYLVVKQSCSK